MKLSTIYFNLSSYRGKAKSFLLSCLLIIGFSMSVSSLWAQDMFGISNSNYSGTNSLLMNPSTFVDNRLLLDINLITFGVTMDNDYVYVPKDSLSFFGFKHLVDVINNDGLTDAKNYTYNGKPRSGNLEVLLRGPSATFQIGKSWFAIQGNLRGAGTLTDLNFALLKFSLEKQGLHTNTVGSDPYHRVNFDAPKFTIGGMVWGEIGLTYGHVLVDKNKDYLKGALTIKRLVGYASAYVRADAGMSYNITKDPNDPYSVANSNNGDTIHDGQGVMLINNAHVQYGHSFTSQIGANPFDPNQINGHGWGFDFGLTYEYRPDYDKYKYSMDGQRIDDPNQNHYKLRLGVSILDIGKINFDKNAKALDLGGNSASYFDSTTLQWTPGWYGWDTLKLHKPSGGTQVDDFDARVSKAFYQDNPNGSYRGNAYDMGLPRAFSMQVDYNPVKYIYANVTWKQRWVSNAPEVQAANMLALTPRFEKDWLEVAVPLSLYEYNQFRVGIALRVAGFVIGSDKIGSLMGLTDLGGMDVYTSLKFLIERKKVKDRDGDGVSDKLDKCPDQPGPWATMGCPDRDGDGIIDREDSCPDVAGPKELHGCPDRDGDGIPDKDDLCPDVKGLAQFHGCPDTDGDGIPDPQDSCPTVPGLPEFHGCPDTDGDGIPDQLDSCPTVKGPIEFHGCPDTDGDGLIDKLDSCPLVAGPISNHGCPIVEKVEKPKEPVKVELTKEEEEVINKVFKNLEFETAKSIIRESSFASLNELAQLLNKKPNFKLLIDGHTDNVGKAAYNMKLSQDRANSVKTYLVNKGIDASRVTAKGYGLTKPIASNKTAEGRQKNRRVEFTIVE